MFDKKCPHCKTELPVCELLNTALLCIKSSDEECRACPLRNKTNTYSECKGILIENLYKLISDLSEKIVAGDYTSYIAQAASQHWYRQNQEYICILKEEIEKLKKQGITYKFSDEQIKELHRRCLEDVEYNIKLIKAEAYKEFAERLCAKRVSNDPVVIAVKAELKEMGCDNA